MDVKTAIEKRRSFRMLDPFKVTNELIEDLAAHAGLAPSCMNNQPWRFVFVYSPEKLAELKKTFGKQNDWAKDVSLVIAVVSKKDLDCVVPDGREYYLYDAGIATAFLNLRAEELGLVVHVTAGYDQEKTKAVLGVPNDHTIISLMIVGKHSKETKSWLDPELIEIEKKRPERINTELFAFHDKFGSKRA